jgi:hypothetical protein
LKYLVIECKSDSAAGLIAKRYVDQSSGHMHWFGENYDQTCAATPVIVHPATIVAAEAAPHPDLRLVGPDQLTGLRGAIRAFVTALSTGGWTDPAQVKVALVERGLDAASLVARHTTLPGRQ